MTHLYRLYSAGFEALLSSKVAAALACWARVMVGTYRYLHQDDMGQARGLDQGSSLQLLGLPVWYCYYYERVFTPKPGILKLTQGFVPSLAAACYQF